MSKFDILNLYNNFLEGALNFIFYGFVIFLFSKLQENFVFFPKLIDGFPVIYGIGENFALL